MLNLKDQLGLYSEYQSSAVAKKTMYVQNKLKVGVSFVMPIMSEMKKFDIYLDTRRMK